jgi:aryl-alcohol dehydrogenase-like predicted oxidoreductase
MRQVTIPGTTLETSKLGYGTASLHHLTLERERRDILTVAIDQDFTHFDTARMYGEGLAENVLGRFFDGGLRKRVTLATKFGLPANPLFERFPGLMYAQRALSSVKRRVGLPSRHGTCQRILTPAVVESSLSKSLNALRTDWLDILFLHEPQVEDISALYDLCEWLIRQKTNGRVRYLGLAGNAANCIAVIRAIDGVFDVLQVEDSLAKHEADIVTAMGRPLQVTYGYLRRAGELGGVIKSSQSAGFDVMNAAFRRNPNGMILVSSRTKQRLQALASLAV